MKRASVIKFKKRQELLFQSTSTMKEGGGINTEPYISLSLSENSHELFKSLMKVLDASKLGVAKPKNFDRTLKQYLSTIGLKDHDDLYKDTVCVTVVNRNGNLEFFPSQNEGLKGGFAVVVDDKITIAENSSPADVAQALLNALEKCK